MDHDPTRPTLLARVMDSGDQDAWREFDTTYHDLILSYCRNRGLQPADAEDVRQLVMMSLARALRSMHYRRERGRFRSYLGTVVRNAIARHLSRPSNRSVRLETEVRAVLEARDSDDLDETWEREWVQHHYRRAMKTIQKTFEERSVLIFEELLAGVPTRSLAERFDLTEPAVHQVKQRIKTRLRQLIEEQVREEEDDDAGTS